MTQALSDQLQTITLHDATRFGTAFVVETVLMTKLFSSARNVCRMAKANIAQLIEATEVAEVAIIAGESIPIKIANANLRVATVRSNPKYLPGFFPQR